MRKLIDLIANNQTENQVTTLTERHLTPALKKQRDKVSRALEREHPDWAKPRVYAIATKAAEKTVKEDEELEEATLSAKAGRAGRDLGKKGKNFKKIEDKAAKEYGSKEAGERVAGAILAKMREHVKEAFGTAGMATKVGDSDEVKLSVFVNKEDIPAVSKIFHDNYINPETHEPLSPKIGKFRVTGECTRAEGNLIIRAIKMAGIDAGSRLL